MIAHRTVKFKDRPFNNATIREPANKPHIVLINGLWRVSAWKPNTGQAYFAANSFAFRLNMRRLTKD